LAAVAIDQKVSRSDSLNVSFDALKISRSQRLDDFGLADGFSKLTRHTDTEVIIGSATEKAAVTGDG